MHVAYVTNRYMYLINNVTRPISSLVYKTDFGVYFYLATVGRSDLAFNPFLVTVYTQSGVK